MGHWHTHGSPNLGQKTRPYNNQQKKRISKIVDFAVSTDHRIKLKECEKKDKYLDLTRELKKLWIMWVTIVPIVIGTFGTVTKGLLKGLGGWRTSGDRPNDSIIKNGQNTEKSPGDLRRLAVTQTLVKKPSANADVKNSKGVNNNLTFLWGMREHLFI